MKSRLIEGNTQQDDRLKMEYCQQLVKTIEAHMELSRRVAETVRYHHDALEKLVNATKEMSNSVRILQDFVLQDRKKLRSGENVLRWITILMSLLAVVISVTILCLSGW